MDFISESVLFAAASGLCLGAGVLTHVVGFKLRWRAPARVLRAFYASAVICAGVGIFLFADYLLA